MGETIQARAADGHVLAAYLARPAGQVRGGLVVVQEAFGVTPYIRAVCDGFAAEGYASVAPALYDRQIRNVDLDHDGASLAKARELRRGLKWPEVLADIAAAMTTVKEAGRVGIVGYCVGGSVAWLAAAELPVTAASSYYGRDIVDFLDKPPRCPTILHFGERDRMIPQDDVGKIRAAYPDLPIHVYAAGHGFDCPGREPDDIAANLARERTLALFRAHIG